MQLARLSAFKARSNWGLTTLKAFACTESIREAIGSRAAQNVAASLLDLLQYGSRDVQWLPLLACWLSKSGLIMLSNDL